MKIQLRRTVFLTLAFFIIYFVLSFIPFEPQSSQSFKSNEPKNILDFENDFKTRRNIFFVESSSNKSLDEVSINNRQACSIESAALMNPNAHVAVILVTDLHLRRTKTVEALMKYPNIRFYRLGLVEFSSNSPVEQWLESGAMYDTKYPVETISDMVRLLLLWR